MAAAILMPVPCDAAAAAEADAGSHAVSKATNPPPGWWKGTRNKYAWRWDARHLAGIACCVVIALIIAPGGSGGSQLHYPLFNVLLGMPIRDTAPVVSFVMFMGAILSCGMAIVERHPTDPERRPRIDYGAVLIFSPAVLLGVSIGVILNAILPKWMLQAASITVFTWAFVRILISYISLHQSEQARDAAAVAVAEDLIEVAGTTANDGDDGATDADVDVVVRGLARTLSKMPSSVARGSSFRWGAAADAKRHQPEDMRQAVSASSAGEGGGDRAGDSVALRALVRSMSAVPAIGRRAAGVNKSLDPEGRTAEDLRAFCALDAQVHALEAAVLDDYPLQGRAAAHAFDNYHQAPDTALVSAAVHAAALLRSASMAAPGDRGLQAQRSLRRSMSIVKPSAGSSAAQQALQRNSSLKVFAESFGSGEHPETAATTEELPPASDSADGAAVPAVRRFAARLCAWARRQPALLIGLTLAVLAQHVVFSILRRTSVVACSPGFWALIGARVGITAAIAAAVSWIVMRQQRREEEEGEAGQDDVLDSEDSMRLWEEHCPTIDEKMVSAEEGVPPQPLAAAKKPSWVERRRQEEEAARQRNWEFIKWRPKDIATMNCVMLLIGILAGCLGLGGSFATTPLLLGMGIHPQCQAATSKAILFISTCASSVSYLIAGRMPLMPALIFGTVNLAVTPIGIIVMNKIIARTGRPSLLVALNMMSYGVGILLLLAMSGIPGWIATAQGRVPAGFSLHNLCKNNS